MVVVHWCISKITHWRFWCRTAEQSEAYVLDRKYFFCEHDNFWKI